MTSFSTMIQGALTERVPFCLPNILDRDYVFVLNDSFTAHHLFSIFQKTKFKNNVVYLESFDSSVFENSICDRELFLRRSRALAHLSNADLKILITTVNALNFKVPKPEFFQKSLTLFPQNEYFLKKILDDLNNLGYHKNDVVNSAGFFASRGGILDIFPNNSTFPVRLDFLGNELESIKQIDPITQISQKNIKSIKITKCSEIIFNEESKHLFKQKYIAGNEIFKEAVENSNFFPGIEWHLSSFHQETISILNYNFNNPLFILDFETDKTHIEFFEKHKNHKLFNSVFSDSFSEISKKFEVIKLNPFEKNNTIKKIDRFYNIRTPEDFILFDSKLKKDQDILSLSSTGSLNIISDIFKNHEINIMETFEDFQIGKINCIISELQLGFSLINQTIYTESEIFGEILNLSSSRKKKNIFKDFSKLSVGDYVVHEKHGIAIFEGLKAISVSNIEHDFLSLIYKDNDRLYVPIENISLITRYGDNDSEINLDSLKSGNWTRKKLNVRKKILTIANNLLTLSAKRALNKIKPMVIVEEYSKFSKGFGYRETEDQQEAINDVLTDLQGNITMDRLVCGDVGFGKTEIALRAAFVCASNFRQVVLLAPTTVLVSQHFKNFSKRFEDFGIKVCQISRFTDRKDLAQNLKDIESGCVQIIIGTHALLSSKLKFNDLGLIIIDEEHHFGVKQKERLKSVSASAHFMTLSATPIPRTLQLAICGIKDFSMITTPPTNRLAVKTNVCDFSKDSIKNAIEFEISRGGQVFFVTPRVEYLETLYKTVLDLNISNVKIAKLQGGSKDIEQTLIDFCENKMNVLVSTNIIDSGVDIPNVNTILIHRFDLFGLSQIYQLRGRVGRAKNQAYAYFLLDPKKKLTDSAKKRMEILCELNKLGGGFSLATHDMDLRGSGNLLGDEQSGYIKEIGVELYQSMLKETILMLKAGGLQNFQDQEKNEPQINLGVPVIIPEYYIPESSLRLDIYKRIGTMETMGEIDYMEFEFSDRFGKIPFETKNLLKLMKIKIYCAHSNISKLDVGPFGFSISFFNNECKNIEGLLKFINNKKLLSEGFEIKLRGSQQKITICKRWDKTSQRTEDVLKITKFLDDHLKQ